MKVTQLGRNSRNHIIVLGIASYLICHCAVAVSQEILPSLESYLHHDTDLFSARPSTLQIRLDKAVDCAALEFTLFQRAAVLATPVTLEEDVKCEIVAAESHATQIELLFRTPRVGKRLSFVWVIAECRHGRDRCEELATTPFQVYPDNLLAPLKAWSSANILRVNDPSGEIEALLDKNKIEYVPTFSAPVRASKETRVLTLLYEVEGERLSMEEIKKGLMYGNVIAFITMDNDADQMLDSLPVIYHQRENYSLTSISLPLVPYLERGPRAQSIFMELFHLAVNQHVTTRGNTNGKAN